MIHPIRSAIAASSAVLRLAKVLVGKARDLATGRDDDDIWTSDTLDERPLALTGATPSAPTATSVAPQPAAPPVATPAVASPPAAMAEPATDEPTAVAPAPEADNTEADNTEADNTEADAVEEDAVEEDATATSPTGATGLAARLEAISGIGPAKRAAILEVFDTEEELLAADPHTLSEIDGISTRLAKLVLDGLTA